MQRPDHNHADDHTAARARWLNGKACLIAGVALVALIFEAAIVMFLMPSSAEIAEADRELLEISTAGESTATR